MTYQFAKRCTDLLISFVTLIFFSPIFLFIAIIVKLNSVGPTLYKGERTGINGSVFYILKFRTMVADAEKKGGFSTALNDPRFTPIGRILRKYKLDELPQFLNVLKGEMSLVGPRPQVKFYTDKYKNDDKLIISVRPGITDYASLYFVDMDSTLGTGDVDTRYIREIEPLKNWLRLMYVKEKSFFIDIRILIETAFKLFGVNNATGLNVVSKAENFVTIK